MYVTLKVGPFGLVGWIDILHCCFNVLFDAPLAYWILE
jgi:hypothetical protein